MSVFHYVKYTLLYNTYFTTLYYYVIYNTVLKYMKLGMYALKCTLLSIICHSEMNATFKLCLCHDRKVVATLMMFFDCFM